LRWLRAAHSAIAGPEAGAVESIARIGPPNAEPLRPVHNVVARLDPEHKRITATDTVTLDQIPQDYVVRLDLARGFSVVSVRAGTRDLKYKLAGNVLTVTLSPGCNAFSVQYAGVVDGESEQRISPKGAYLVDEGNWYPNHADVGGEFTLSVEMPSAWKAVGPGQLVDERLEGDFVRRTWKVSPPNCGAYLVAGPYESKASEIDGLPVTTFLLDGKPEGFAQVEDATRTAMRQLVSYFGPFPFPSLQVVVGGTVHGGGMPGAIVIPDDVLSKPRELTDFLAHELAHDWWAGTVFGYPWAGFWYEAVCESTGRRAADGDDTEVAKAHRQADLKAWEKQFGTMGATPLVHMRSYEPWDEHAPVIYAKGAFVMDMLRREIGDGKFYAALRELGTGFKGKVATWQDLCSAFEKVTERDLSWFFDQWLHRRGAAQLSLAGAQGVETKDGFVVRGQISQTGKPYALHIPVVVTTASGPVEKMVWLDAKTGVFSVPVPERPEAVSLDPGCTVFRLPSAHEYVRL